MTTHTTSLLCPLPSSNLSYHSININFIINQQSTLYSLASALLQASGIIVNLLAVAICHRVEYISSSTIDNTVSTLPTPSSIIPSLMHQIYYYVCKGVGFIQCGKRKSAFIMQQLIIFAHISPPAILLQK